MNKTNLTLIVASLIILQCNASSMDSYFKDEGERHLRYTFRRNIVGITEPIKIVDKGENNHLSDVAETLCTMDLSYFGLDEETIIKIMEQCKAYKDKELKDYFGLPKE